MHKNTVIVLFKFAELPTIHKFENKTETNSQYFDRISGNERIYNVYMRSGRGAKIESTYP